MKTETRAATMELVNAIGQLMDGEQVPAAGSPEMTRLEDRVGRFLNDGTSADQEMLGLCVLRLLIDRVRARIATDAALRDAGGSL